MPHSPIQSAMRRSPILQPSLRGHTQQSTGSVTQTITSTPTSGSSTPQPIVLRLRGFETPPAPRTSPERRIQWAEGTIDNEHMNKKKSKVCCIYHKNREVGESSSEDDSSDSSDSDSSVDNGEARRVGRSKGRRSRRGDKHEHNESCGHGSRDARRPSPNAYERQPRYDIQPLNQQVVAGTSRS